jgi:kynurenine formamidase
MTEMKRGVDMKKTLDLSHTIDDRMPVHPYDGEVSLFRDKTLEQDKYNNSRLTTGMHAGTHIDAPGHFLESSLYISDYPLERFMGDGCLLDVRGETVISFREEYEHIVGEGSIVLLLTGLGTLYRTPAYYQGFNDHPLVDVSLAEFFCRKRIKMLGLDTPKPDNYPFEIHRLLLSKGIFILENLTNLEALVGVPEFEVIAFPLKIRAEGSPVRAVARFSGKADNEQRLT